MKKTDLHLHTKYSDRPSEWFLQKLGTAESYTDPETALQKAQEAGMDFVTVTDHNCIAASLELKKKYPSIVISGTELTTYFPEDGCKIHLLLFGMNPAQFKEADTRRDDIYSLREYVIENNIAHSVAHGAYSINKKLTVSHLEKLMLLFNVFESINGSRDSASNTAWESALRSLTPEKITELYDRHKIMPFSTNPWVKGFTGGSDDHAGIFIGRTWTESDASSPEDFIDMIRSRGTYAKGRHNSYHSFVFAIYKIVYDFSARKSTSTSKSLLSQLTEFIFNKDTLGVTDKIKVSHFRKNAQAGGSRINLLLAELIEEIHSPERKYLDAKFDLVYDKIALITDEFMRLLFLSFEKDLSSGNVAGLIKSVSSSIPGVFISLPFFSALTHFYSSRTLISSLKNSFKKSSTTAHKRVLWFTDTLTDLNGVSGTLRNLASVASKMGRDIFLVTCKNDPSASPEALPENSIILPHIHSFKLPNYENYTMSIPSILRSIKIINNFKPDEIFISTPGPVGLIGLLFAKVLNIKCTGVFHTDFTGQIRDIINDESAASLAESGMRWFYSSMSEIQVPTREYISILKNRGYDYFKMKVFKRGIDSALFSRKSEGVSFMENNFALKPGPTLLYTGRISKDKNLDFLREVFLSVAQEVPGVSLIIAGDGPYLNSYKNSFPEDSRVIFTGRQKHETMPLIYSASDILLFPSNTDTFGMSVLEAQSCRVPAIVSDIGGPKEIILDLKTGIVAKANDKKDWVNKTVHLIRTKESNPQKFADFMESARQNVILNYDWKNVVNSITSQNFRSSGTKVPAYF